MKGVVIIALIGLPLSLLGVAVFPRAGHGLHRPLAEALDLVAVFFCSWPGSSPLGEWTDGMPLALLAAIPVLTLVLAGGAGTRLQPLTQRRCKPGVPFGGNFRIIDFALMNCVSSGLREAYVLTQYRPEVLVQHFGQRWSSLSGQLRLTALPPGESGRYVGTADAVYKNLELLRLVRPEVVLILSGDQVYRADYRPLLEEHLRTSADVTVLADSVLAGDASSFGVLEVSTDRRIRRFVEKPRDPLSYAREGKCSINLGIYCFRPEFLLELLLADAQDGDSAHDFGRNILPAALDLGLARSYPLTAVSVDDTPYWRDVGTVDSYFEANLDLVREPAGFTLADKRWAPNSPFWQWLPAVTPAAAEIDGRRIEGRNIISPSVKTEGASVVNTILSPGVEIGAGAELDGCVVLPGARIGRGSRLRRVIVEENVWVLPGTEIGRCSSIGKTSSAVTVLNADCRQPSRVAPAPSNGGSLSGVAALSLSDRRIHTRRMSTIAND